MAKQPITEPSYGVANIQGLADVVQGDADAIKVMFDKVGKETKDYIIEVLIAELNGPDGASKIGINIDGMTANNVLDAIVEGGGSIPDNSIEDIKLANTVKIGNIGDFVGNNSGPDASNVIDAVNITYNLADGARLTAESAYSGVDFVQKQYDLSCIIDSATGNSAGTAYVAQKIGSVTYGEGWYKQRTYKLSFITGKTNTGPCTLAIFPDLPSPIKKSNGVNAFVELSAGDIVFGKTFDVFYDDYNGCYILC